MIDLSKTKHPHLRWIFARRRPNTLVVNAKSILVLSISILATFEQPIQAQPAKSASTAAQPFSVQEMIDARTDVWGDAAVRQPNGASYEFFKDLLPPPRWVNTDFRHYPIVLGAPRSRCKSRLVSNGSSVNARANKPPMWHEQGVPVTFHVGKSAELFGGDLTRLEEPGYLNGYLPVVTFKYGHNDATYREEVFAPVNTPASAHGTTMLRFAVATHDKVAGGNGQVEARLESEGPLTAQDSEVLNERGQSLVAFSSAWRWDIRRKTLVAQLSSGGTADLAIFTRPKEPGTKMSSAMFDKRKRECVKAWDALLDRTIQLETPEPIVNNAWRATLLGNFIIAAGDKLNYSAGNAYASLYEAECGDTLRSLMLFGHHGAAPAMLKLLLEFNREATRFHVAGHKLQLLAHYYWLTRDAHTIRAYAPFWRPSVELILASREPSNGLLPKDNYAGDISTTVYSLNSNANCWRGLRDVAAMLDEMGDKEEGRRLQTLAVEYRKRILEAVVGSERLDAKPPFIPNALLADEPAHDPLTSTRTGSYYDLMCPYIIGSEIFGQGSDREDWLLGYLQNHGGIAMGMPRSRPFQGEFTGQHGVNPLYGLRYQLALLRRDEREKTLVGFYGHLAQGMTRGTFLGGEGNRFVHGDKYGRSFYLPPNSASSAAWLITLRNLLVQDWDLDEDAKPDTLRLLFAVPRRWLADGQQIRVENAPTMFGPVSCRVKSKLSDGYIEVHVKPPQRPVKAFLLRAPLPNGWKIVSVESDGKKARLIGRDTINLTGTQKPLTVRFIVEAI